MHKMELSEAVKRNCLPDYLSIRQWVWLRHPDPDNQADYDDRIKRHVLELDRRILTEKILDACKAGVLRFEGDINGWKWDWKLYPNPYPLTENNIFVRCKPIRLSAKALGKPYETRDPDDCVIHKADMKPYLIHEGIWPIEIKGLRDDYWPDDDLEIKSGVDTDAGSQINTKQRTQTDKINPRNKQRENETLIVIHAALDEMEGQNNKTPSHIELAAFMLGGGFKHSNIQEILNAEEGSLIDNRVLLLTDGTKLDKKGVKTRYQKTIYKIENPDQHG